MSEIAWTRNDLPDQLKVLEPDLHLWAKGLYNGFVIAGSEDAEGLTLQYMIQSTERDLKQAGAHLSDWKQELNSLSTASDAAPAAIDERIAWLEKQIGTVQQRITKLKERKAALEEAAGG